jgi:membrane protease subunit HflK
VPKTNGGPYEVDFGRGGGGFDVGGFLRGLFGGRFWSLLGLILLLVGAFSSYYQVEPADAALVTRFGKYTETTYPGPHFKWPFGIESVVKIPVQRQLKAEFGFRTLRAAVRTEYEASDETRNEARMLTGDLNVADVEWIVQYKIKDPYKYVFRVRQVESTLRDLSETVMRKVVGDHSVSEVLTVGREQVQLLTKNELQRMCNHYEMGIEILQLVLQDVNPPDAVRESFNEVNQAIQERERAINQAWASYNAVVPEAQGKSAQQIQSAEGYGIERVNNARGDVQRFLALQTEYARAPAVTRARIYLETMAKVIPATRKRVFIDDRVKGIVPLFPLEAATAKALPAGGKP